MVFRIVRTGEVVVTLVLAALVLVGELVVLQGQRDESRRVDALVVLCAGVNDGDDGDDGDDDITVCVNHALDRYRQGLASHLVLLEAAEGAAAQHLREALATHHLPAEALLTVGRSGHDQADMQHIAALLYQHGMNRVLLVDTPDALLRHLKMARDLGLVAYGAPLPNSRSPELRAVLRASLDYWSYVLFNHREDLENEAGDHRP
ncbi:MAG: DUF218 domain-containing protein [Chloroflexaceae bacterium]|nr:DUF218 domain-containing protein [Chloroflexaceae bacterium]